jgi:glycine cleavage system transcriptional repressor
VAKAFALSVMARDRVGIVAGLTEAVLQFDGNIDALSQTVLEGYFTLIGMVSFAEDVDAAALLEAVKAEGSVGELEVTVKERVEGAGHAPPAHNDTFVLTVSGPDQSGIIHRMTEFLADRQINIDDLYAFLDGDEFRLMAELEVPPDRALDRLLVDMESLWREQNIRVSLHHKAIFMATTDVGFGL